MPIFQGFERVWRGRRFLAMGVVERGWGGRGWGFSFG